MDSIECFVSTLASNCLGPILDQREYQVSVLRSTELLIFFFSCFFQPLTSKPSVLNQNISIIKSSTNYLNTEEKKIGDGDSWQQAVGSSRVKLFIRLHDDSAASGRCPLGLIKSQVAHVDAIILCLLLAFVCATSPSLQYPIGASFVGQNHSPIKGLMWVPAYTITHNPNLKKLFLVNKLSYFNCSFKYLIGYLPL